MARLWFMHYLGRVVPPAVMERICGNAKLPPKRIEYLVMRFCHGNSMFACEQLGPGYSESDQRRFMPDLDTQLRSWLDEHPSELSPEQRKALYSWLLTGKPYREGSQRLCRCECGHDSEP